MNYKTEIIFGLIFLSRVFHILLTVRQLQKGTDLDDFSDWCKRIGRWIVHILLFAPIFVLFIINDDIVNCPFIRIWFIVELINFFVEPAFFLSIMKILKMTLDQQNEMQNTMKGKFKKFIALKGNGQMETEDSSSQEATEKKPQLMRQRTKAAQAPVFTVNDDDSDLEREFNIPIDYRGRMSTKTESFKKEIQKKVFEFEENQVTMTVLCYLKEQSEKFKLNEARRSQNLYNTIYINIFQFTMLTCMLVDIMLYGKAKIPRSFITLLVKFPCSAALHLMLAPQVAQGMMIMNFSNNQGELFVEYGSQISFILGFLQFIAGIYCEMINMYLLTYQKNVEYSIIHFVALEMIMELPSMYFMANNYHKMKEICHAHVEQAVIGKDIQFSKRSMFHKIARVVYKVTRLIYVAIIYYFIPFGILFLTFYHAKIKDEDYHGH